jgi:hypothetical protein
MKKLINFALLCVIFVYTANSLFAGDLSVGTFFVINSPSAISAGTDSILTFDSLGNSAVFFGSEHNLTGLQDIVCSPNEPRHIFVSHGAFNVAAEVLEFDASGRIVNTVPRELGALAFDQAGNFYATANGGIFKNGMLFASLPPSTGIGRLAIDSSGNLYLTDPFSTYQVLRIDPNGNVTLFADATDGLLGPYGLAIDSMDNIYVANSIGGPLSILKFDPSGTSTLFAVENSVNISRSMVFDRNDNLYATLENSNQILKFDKAGNSSVFADASDGLNFPYAITVGTCPVRRIVVAEIDIKPGSSANTITPNSKGVIPVAILTTATFDATTINPLSVEFGPSGATEAHGQGHIEDVNQDGEPDLVLHFRTQDTGIQCGDTSASLTGQTVGGEPIEGSDAIKTVGCHNDR